MKVSGYFITGTDTGVGKTTITVALIHKLARAGYRVAGMKPVSSGCRNTALGLRNADAEAIMEAATVSSEYELVNPYAFAPAIAPHIAAMEAGRKIELEKIRNAFESIASHADRVVVEGVGGWRVPLGRVITTEHMAKTLDLPVILVVGFRLGCLNHALLTADAVQEAGMTLAGWVVNELDPAMTRKSENIASLRQRINAPMLGHILHDDKHQPNDIAVQLNLRED